MPVLAVVWHYWIAPLLVALIFLACIGVFVGYLRKVVAPRYHRE